jgi:hypothetical protein
MELMTVEEVAARLKLKRSWVYSNADKLGAYRLGKYLRFCWPRVLECLDQRNSSSHRGSGNAPQWASSIENAIGQEPTIDKTVD